jgi:CheY-like chemotaxis protein
LVVEDDVDIRDTLAALLTEEGYFVETAGNGEEALSKLRGGLSPSLILLDLMMPVLDGFGFVESQKRDPLLRRIPVVVLSALADYLEESSRADFDAVLSKPVDLTALLTIVERVLRRRKTQWLS